ncbi:MAG: hypothetical protein AAFZ18_35465, partial [Myxococcota bacterium]
MKRWVPIAAALVSGGASCARPAVPKLPPLLELSSSTAARQPATVEQLTLEALFVEPTVRATAGVHPADPPLPVVRMVGAFDEEGQLYIDDLVHAPHGGIERARKLSFASTVLTSPHGSFQGPGRFFVPSHDVLATLDSGFRIGVQVGTLRETVVLRPRYDTDRYPPFLAVGRAGPAGRLGAVGPSGRDGDDGENGDDGSDGGRGQDGRDGASGEDGRDAEGRGREGGPGAPGLPGDRGPDLWVGVRPVYSKYYPQEILLLVEISLKRYRPEGIEVSGFRRYLLHAQGQLLIESRGGDGGAGGSGGHSWPPPRRGPPRSAPSASTAGLDPERSLKHTLRSSGGNRT